MSVARKTRAYAAPKGLESSTLKYQCHALVVLLDLGSLQPNGGEAVPEGASFCNPSFSRAQ